MALLANGGSSRVRSTFLFKPTSSTTVLSGADSRGYTLAYTVGEGFVDVIVNGDILPSTEFTATDGTTITLPVAAGSGDTIVVVAYAVVDVANTYTQAQADVNFAIDGGAELYLVDGSNLGIRAAGSGRLRINGKSYPVTAGTLSKSGWGTGGIIYAYAYMNGSTMAYELSLTAAVRHTDGSMIKGADTTRALVGMCLIMGDTGNFHDESTRRTVLSWHNRKPKAISQGVAGASTSAAGALMTLGAVSYFLIWRDQVIDLTMSGYATTNASDYVFTAPKLISPSVQEGQQVGHTQTINNYWATGGSLVMQVSTDSLYSFACGMRTTGSATATTTSGTTGIIWG